MTFHPRTIALVATLIFAPLSAVSGQFPGGPGGFGGVQEDRKLVKVFDKDGDNRLNVAERKAAYDSLVAETANGSARRGFGGPGGSGGRGGPPGITATPAEPGAKLTPANVKAFPTAKVYDLATIRTFFLELEDANWEKELMLFKDTDIELPATLRVDGRTYRDVGVRFRGMSSFMMVPEGQKHSINLALDAVRDTQQLGGYRTLNLLNSHEDASWIHSILYAQIARTYIPAPMANFARVAINGESWGGVRQFAAVQQGLPSRQLRHHGGGALEGPGKSWRAWRPGVHRRRRQSLQERVRNQVKGQSQVMD